MERNDRMISLAGFIVIFPRRYQRNGATKTSSTNGNKNDITAECGNFALIVSLSFSDVHRSPAISGHDEFIGREVDHPSGTMLDLGKCRVESKHVQPQRLHLILVGNKTSSVVTKDNLPLFLGSSVYASWDEKRWFRIVGINGWRVIQL